MSRTMWKTKKSNFPPLPEVYLQNKDYSNTRKECLTVSTFKVRLNDSNEYAGIYYYDINLKLLRNKSY